MPVPAAPAALASVGHIDRFHDGAGGPGRRHRAGTGQGGGADGALPGSRRTGKSVIASIQGRYSDYFGARVLPFGQAERGGPGFAAAAGQISRLRLGGGLPGTRRPAGVTVTSSSTPAGCNLRAVCRCSSTGRLSQAPGLFLPLGHGTVRVEDPGHGPGTPEGVLLQGFFAELESQTRFLRERKAPVHHAHGREAKPLLPDLLLPSGLHLAADL